MIDRDGKLEAQMDAERKRERMKQLARRTVQKLKRKASKPRWDGDSETEVLLLATWCPNSDEVRGWVRGLYERFGRGEWVVAVWKRVKEFEEALAGCTVKVVPEELIAHMVMEEVKQGRVEEVQR